MKKINHNWIKVAIVGVFGLINIALLVVSAIYFAKLEFDKNLIYEYWIKYLWLCIMIISSCFLLGCIFVEASYVDKMILNKKSKKGKS